MSTDLARSARALGREMNFFGSKEKDFVIQTKGRVKINFGDKFVELFNGSKFTTDSGPLINEGKPDSSSSDGFYFDNGTLYLKIGDKIYEIFSNAKEIEGFISYSENQNLNSEEQSTAKKNIGINFETKEEAISKGSNGIVYISSENSAYLLKDGTLYPIIENEDSSSENLINESITIDLDEEGLALIINGFGRCIRIGTEDNNTKICHSSGGTINSSKSLTIKIDNKESIIIKGGEVNFNSIINALQGIITDEIYSSDYKLKESGWGLWIDKNTGESYLQVDNILGNYEITPTYLKYQEAVKLAATGGISIGTTYIITDYQNEWEITPESDLMGVDIVSNKSWSVEDNSVDPSKYEEGEVEPKFGVDRNVRPIIIIGKNSYQFEDTISYYYLEDNKDVLEIRYDIRVQNYNSDSWLTDDSYVDMENKGRIYHMRDSWNNEAPCDFKHFVNEDGNYIFTSPDKKDLSSMNTIDSIVCANNQILDVKIRISEKMSPLITIGKQINNNTFGGFFENVIIGDPESIIEHNTFDGDIKNCSFIGTFNNNSIKCLMDSTYFDSEVINNGFSRDIINCHFYDKVENNIWDIKLEDCTFNIVTDNQFTGSMTNCKFLGDEVRENDFAGDFSDCTWEQNVFSNTIRIDTITNCTFKSEVSSNQITSPKWDNNHFTGTLLCNVFQANVIDLLTEGYLNNNQFIGRIEHVHFYKDLTNPDYGVNNNIINGAFLNCNIYVDFSHNTVTGPLQNSTFNVGTTSRKNCLFNYNDIKASSNNELITYGDFRRNTIKADVFGPATFNGDFESNTLFYFNMRGFTVNKMKECTGKGENFLGDFKAEFEGCEFGEIQNCTFREAPIKFAKFRWDFIGQNFDSGDIVDLELLYDDKHQVSVFFHNQKTTVYCDICNSAMKGEIKMWYPDSGNIPTGWQICDGTNGTPNLIDKFIKADSKTGPSTDSDSMDYPFEINSGNVPVGDHGHPFSVTVPDSKSALNEISSDISAVQVEPRATVSGTTGGPNSGTDKVLEIKLPRYYSLIFIMRL